MSARSWPNGAPEELGGPTSQPGARRRDTGRPGAKQWRPVREFAGFANARTEFQGPDFGGDGRGSNGGAACPVRLSKTGCHPGCGAPKSLILSRSLDFRLSPRLYGPAAAAGRNSCSHSEGTANPASRFAIYYSTLDAAGRYSLARFGNPFVN